MIATNQVNRSLTHENIDTKSGFAHIEFASTEEAVRAVSHGVPHGFRYRQRLLDIDFARWVFFVGPAYRVLYISGWPASDGLSALLRWTYDIPNLGEAAICTFLFPFSPKYLPLG